MADLARAPIVQESSKHPAHCSSPPFQPNNILCGLVAAVLTATLLSPEITRWTPVQHPSHNNGQINLDTSQGTPKTLRPELVLPRGTNRLLQNVNTPDLIRTVVDTSHGMPKTLLPEITLPRGKNDFSGINVQYLWPVVDTSKSTAANFIPAAVVVNPFKNVWVITPDLKRTVTDTSLDIPLPLLSITPRPVANYIYPLPQWKPYQPFDTTQDTPKTLIQDDSFAPSNMTESFPVIGYPRLGLDTTRGFTPQAVIPSPFVPAPHYPPVRYGWLPADTTQDTPKTLFGDATFPVQNLQQPVLDWVRPVTNTSQSTPANFIPATVVPQPVQNLAYITLDILRQVVDTSQSTSVALTTVPFFNAPSFAPAYTRWQPQDMSAGMAKVLYADATTPIFNYQHTAPDPTMSGALRPVVNTTAGSSASILTPRTTSTTRIFWG